MIDFVEKAEIARLERAVDSFAAQMKAVLVEHAKQGKRGWDGRESPTARTVTDSYIIRELWNDATGLDQCAIAGQIGKNVLPTLVDIANRAMMLWYRHKGEVSEQASSTGIRAAKTTVETKCSNPNCGYVIAPTTVLYGCTAFTRCPKCHTLVDLPFASEVKL